MNEVGIEVSAGYASGSHICISWICIRQSQKAMKPTVGFSWCEIDDVVCNVLGAAAGF